MKMEGFANSGFEPVKEMFEYHFERGLEDNAQCCVYVDGRQVVDLWGAKSEQSSYNGDSLQTIFSASKNLESIVIAHLVDQDLLDYNDPVCKHWPEFGQCGKDRVRIEDVLRHESGLPYLGKQLNIQDLTTANIKANRVGAILEAQSLVFPPKWRNTDRDYHITSRGFILNEVVRRVDKKGRTIGEILREDISSRLNVDCHIGVKNQTEVKNRISKLTTFGFLFMLLQCLFPAWMGRKIECSLWEIIKIIWSCARVRREDCAVPNTGVNGLSLMSPFSWIKSFNNMEYSEVEIPSINAVCSARGMAKLSSLIVTKTKLFNNEETYIKMHQDFTEKENFGMANVRDQFSQGGVCAFRLHPEDNFVSKRCKSKREGFVGWGGFGGSFFGWHPELKIGFAYTATNICWDDMGCTKAGRLQEIIVKCAKQMKEKTKKEKRNGISYIRQNGNV